jgi:hypothetical protein
VEVGSEDGSAVVDDRAGSVGSDHIMFLNAFRLWEEAGRKRGLGN